MDRRIIRTRSNLQTALLELALTEPLDDITIGDITERAHVNRSSFYLHYSDKETLLADALETQLKQVHHGITSSEAQDQNPPIGLVEYLAHIDRYADLYRRIMAGEGTGSGEIISRLRTQIQAIIRDDMPALPENIFSTLPPDIAIASITGAAISIIRAWLEQKPRPSIDVVAHWCWHIVAPTNQNSTTNL